MQQQPLWFEISRFVQISQMEATFEHPELGRMVEIFLATRDGSPVHLQLPTEVAIKLSEGLAVLLQSPNFPLGRANASRDKPQ